MHLWCLYLCRVHFAYVVDLATGLLRYELAYIPLVLVVLKSVTRDAHLARQRDKLTAWARVLNDMDHRCLVADAVPDSAYLDRVCLSALDIRALHQATFVIFQFSAQDLTTIVAWTVLLLQVCLTLAVDALVWVDVYESEFALHHAADAVNLTWATVLASVMVLVNDWLSFSVLRDAVNALMQAIDVHSAAREINAAVEFQEVYQLRLDFELLRPHAEPETPSPSNNAAATTVTAVSAGTLEEKVPAATSTATTTAATTAATPTTSAASAAAVKPPVIVDKNDHKRMAFASIRLIDIVHASQRIKEASLRRAQPSVAPQPSDRAAPGIPPVDKALGKVAPPPLTPKQDVDEYGDGDDAVASIATPSAEARGELLSPPAATDGATAAAAAMPRQSATHQPVADIELVAMNDYTLPRQYVQRLVLARIDGTDILVGELKKLADFLSSHLWSGLFVTASGSIVAGSQLLAPWLFSFFKTHFFSTAKKAV